MPRLRSFAPLLLALLAFSLALCADGFSQAPAKRPLTHADYSSWRTLSLATIANDASSVAWLDSPADADGEIVLRDLTTGKVFRHTIGSRPAAPITPAAAAKGRPTRTPPSNSFSPDGKTLVFTIYPPKTDRTKVKTPAAPTPAIPAPINLSLGLMNTSDGKVVRLEKVRSFQLPELGSVFVYMRGTTPAPVDPTKAKAATLPKTTSSGELVVRSFVDGKERALADVSEYSLSKDGQLLLYTVNDKKDASGLYALATTADSLPVALGRGEGRFAKLAWDEKQSQLAFLHSTSPSKDKDGNLQKARHTLHYWKRTAELPASGMIVPPPGGLIGLASAALQPKANLAEELVAAKPAFQPGCEMTDAVTPSFSQDGTRVYFGLTPPAKKASDSKVNVELWHYNDDFIQPMQKARAEGSRGKTYRAVFHLSDRSARQLSDETLTDVTSLNSPEWDLATDDRPYRQLVGSQEVGAPSDVLLVNTKTGVRKTILKKQNVAVPSPGGKFILNYDGKNWHSTSVPEGKKVNLTGKLKVSFANELDDHPATPPAYGIGGWTKDDAHVLLYDRYDIWLVAGDGSLARNLTDGLGRKLQTTLRAVQLDPQAKAFDPEKPLLLRAESEMTRDTGFYRLANLSEKSGSPKQLVMGSRSYSTPMKAKNSDRLFFTVSTFADYPDLHTADADFREIKKLTDGDSQKSKYVWGKAELIKYKSADGLALQGMLIKPENFDPKKKYPMIVYIYERLSQELHGFVAPKAGTSINPTYYASNGYLVLKPDIAYTVGYPGQSSLKCVLPAIQAVVDQGCVDENAIGIQGHSWGGYQTAYLITQTTRFKAACAGAPVANMTSAYGGIRWGTGLPRQFQYEKTQSRIGGTLWQFPTRFVENSPLFMADRVKTPLLMLHNDKDEAVPFQQGIEYYLALRRLGKEVYMFNYPGEFHGLRQRQNQADYTVRMQQFFDHHLKGAAKPEWMAKGIAYTAPPAGTTSPGGRRGESTTPPIIEE
jgi:dipeptidyl aminopeptidase/acylaminoacyl peptidase